MGEACTATCPLISPRLVGLERLPAALPLQKMPPAPCGHPLITAWLWPCSCGSPPAPGHRAALRPGPAGRGRSHAAAATGAWLFGGCRQHPPSSAPGQRACPSAAGNAAVCRAMVRRAARPCFSAERFASLPPSITSRSHSPSAALQPPPHGKAAVPAPPGSRKVSPFHH